LLLDWDGIDDGSLLDWDGIGDGSLLDSETNQATKINLKLKINLGRIQQI
jgi:hypothetical protein